MTDPILAILRRDGPMTSSELVAKLIAEFRTTPEAARKRVSRLRKPATALGGLRLPKNARYVYLEEDFASERYYQRLSRALKETGSAYGRALVGVSAQGGSVPRKLFPIVSGLPFRNTRKQLRHDFVEAKLLQVGLLLKIDTPDGPQIQLRTSNASTKRRRAERVVEEILLGIIKSHLGRMNLTSYEAAEIRAEKLPAVGQFHWDFAGPTYMAGMTHLGPERKHPGFIVGDILLGHQIARESLNPFFSKCDALLNQRRTARITPFFAADYFEKEALDQLRRRGCLILTPETLYGREFAQLLRQLMLSLENAAAALTNDPNGVFKILDSLMKIEGAALNLRGVVLEFLVAAIFAEDGYKFDIRQKVTSENGEQAEIDIKAMKRAECVCVECKAPLPGNLVRKSEIEEWVDISLPRIKSWLKQRETVPEKIRFEFCVSTDFADDALPLIAKLRRTHVHQPIEFLSGDAIRQRLRERKLTAQVRIFDEQFKRTIFPRAMIVPSARNGPISHSPAT